MTISEILMMEQSLHDLSKEKVPFGLAIKISKLIAEVKEVQSLARERLNRIAQEYGEKDDNGQLILDTNTKMPKIKTEHVEAFQTETTDVYNTEYDLSSFTIPEEEFEKGLPQVSSEILIALLPIIK